VAVTLPAEAYDELRDLLGERLSTADSVLDLHGRDESHFPPCRPDAVAFVRSTEDVVQVVRTCVRHGVPLVPFGIGSSLEGHVLPTAGGVSLDLSQMNRILEINEADLDARVQAGVTKDQLNAALGQRGLFFAVDPGSDATIGGMASTGASGTMTVRYGTIRENVLALEVVLADGSVVRTGTRARKSSAGYDLTHLFLGAEGTLGVITELVVRTWGIPERVAAAICSFPSVRAAVEAAIQIVQLGVPIARCELVDAESVRQMNLHSGLGEKAAPTLLFEFHGSEASVADQVESVRAVCDELGGEAFRWATHEEERARLWRARHDAYFAMLTSRPGSRILTTDACVPVSRLAECIEETLADAASLPFVASIVGHVADGNFHCGLPIQPDSVRERELAEAFAARLAERAIAMGGTCTGEHGVGFGKRRYLTAERGEEAIELMRSLKRALDPDGLLNPGKVLPD
jgi:D-lactate dehydrogenase (cytochrome)